ncbi:hypothetical protein XAC2852_10009 [Xanthomonas citri pv. citri]|nr:hypothetical protein XAC2852_10009 [Xanthomonas citri pv. citri]CEH78037.1 hypothetical protein XACB100_10009 [Xanthomonas citri pv. citri]
MLPSSSRCTSRPSRADAHRVVARATDDNRAAAVNPYEHRFPTTHACPLWDRRRNHAGHGLLATLRQLFPASDCRNTTWKPFSGTETFC